MNKLLLCATAGVLGWGAVARADAPVAGVPLVVPEAVADSAAVWAGLQSGQLSPAQAWQDGLLDSATVQVGLAKGLAGGEDQKSKQLRRELGGLLVKNAPDVVAHSETLPAGVQLVLADYYASQSDERAAPLYEAVIVQTKGDYNLGLRLLALGQFWSAQGQAQKAQDAFARGREIVRARHTLFAAEMSLYTARAWAKAGEQDKANAFYDQTLADGAEMMSGLVIYDKTGELLRAGKTAEARQLVTQTLKGMTDPLNRAIQLMMLAQANYAGGDFAAAQTAAQSCLAEAAKIKDVNPAIGFDVVAPTAQDLLRWSKLWQKQPLICGAEILTRSLASPNEKPVWKTRLSVRSFQAVPLRVSCDDARVKCTVLPVQNDPWFPRRETRFAEQIIEVEVPLKTALQTELHISSAQLPGATCDIPLQIGS